ncbi:MAG: DNA polymerase [Sphaerochaetaceae bacterium]
MNYLVFSEEELDGYPITFLVPTIRKDDIAKTYITPFNIDPNEVLVVGLSYSQTKKKTPVSEIRQYCKEVLTDVLRTAKAEIVVVADADYFKELAGVAKAEAHLGYALDSGYGDFKVVYVPNYRAMFYDPVKIGAKIKQGMETVISLHQNNYTDPGADIIHFAEYPVTTQDIKVWLDKLLDMNCPLTIDIEAFGLKHYDAGIGSISFAWNKNEGIAFAVDYEEIPGATKAPFGTNMVNHEVRALLREFFDKYAQKAIYHNACFDIYILIYQLYMKDLLDTEGLLHGLDVMMSNFDCTKQISYLATNSCAGNKLGLKDQAQEFAGNYAEEEIKDITKIPLERLLQYNLVDSLSTWHVREKNYPVMVRDQQLEIYDTLFKPTCVDIVEMQLTGMPLNHKRVMEVKAILLADEAAALTKIRKSPVIEKYTHEMNEAWVHMKNTTLVKKRVSMADAKEVFNPNSNDQLQDLLFNRLGLPILGLTKSKQPSTDGDTLKALQFHTADPVVKELLAALVDFKLVNKVITSFIEPMVNAPMGPDGWHYLFGNFNLGGTVSGRLSSSKINLQNMPVKGIYGKLLKSCFQAPPGWLFVGLDFASLEDRISALTTKDSNKLKVYTGVVIYTLTINGVDHHIRDDATIIHDGKTYTGGAFYDAYCAL